MLSRPGEQRLRLAEGAEIFLLTQALSHFLALVWAVFGVLKFQRAGDVSYGVACCATLYGECLFIADL